MSSLIPTNFELLDAAADVLQCVLQDIEGLIHQEHRHADGKAEKVDWGAGTVYIPPRLICIEEVIRGVSRSLASDFEDQSGVEKRR